MQKRTVRRIALFIATLGLALVAILRVAQARPATPHIEIRPATSVVLGDPVSIRLTNLEKRQEYELTTDLVDPFGQTWRSTAVFAAGRERTLELSRTSPIRGDYDGPDGLGVFWSGNRVESPLMDTPARPAVSSLVTFTLKGSGKVLATRTLDRWFVAPGVEVHEVREKGIVGELYEPRRPGRRPALLLLGGSGGGIQWQRTMAGLLASHGYCALALAYFNMEGLPKALDRIPLEYFREAMDVLKNRPGFDGKGVTVIGYSRGAELALVLGSEFKDVSAVVAYAPSCVVFQSFAPPTFPRNASFTRAGLDLPFVPYKRPRPNATSVEVWMDHLSDTAAVARAAIPVERIRGPILLFSGKDDGNWPSTFMADRIVERLRARSFRHEFRHMAFDSAGHGLAQAGFLPTRDVVARNNNGGSARGTAWAQAESWAALIGFLQRQASNPRRP